jgi:6,7-dimethyl-8-ribityllumazine synthase|tara:strand:- start:711 stop:1097 length:387 start_codon:yes stop_codon:yes gene_type:complete
MKKKILIVVANYYKEISKTLVKSTIKKMNNFAKVKIIKVPGVFEIPVTIVKNIKKYDGIIALGCIIKGETPHFDFISKSSINAIMKISVDYRKPIGNGILTCLNMVQAKKRSKKGAEAAEAVKSVLSQ